MKTIIPLKRLIPALVIGPATWLGPYIAAASLFIPGLIQQLDPNNKVELLALFSVCAMIVGSISNITAGYLSDRTRSRFGKRAPWIMFGATTFMIALLVASTSNSITFLLISWVLAQIGLNFIVAPMVAWIDFASKEGRGTASSAYGGIGFALGNNGFTIIAAMFLTQIRLGFITFGIITFIGTLIAVLIVREPSNLDEKIELTQKKEKLSIQDALRIFPNWTKGRDYYLALIAKLSQGIGNFAITGYLLYIMTDYMHQNTADTQSSIQLINVIMFALGLTMGLVVGPLSDKLKLLKIPVGLSTIFLGIGALSMYFFPNNFGIIAYGLTAGLGMGVWNSLDNLLNLEVIPDKNQVAFFLGIYNLGNTLTQAIAPVIAAFVISQFGFSMIFIVSFMFSMVGGILILSIKSVKR